MHLSPARSTTHQQPTLEALALCRSLTQLKVWGVSKKKYSTRMRFELTRAEPNGLPTSPVVQIAGHRLNHSAILSISTDDVLQPRI